MLLCRAIRIDSMIHGQVRSAQQALWLLATCCIVTPVLTRLCVYQAGYVPRGLARHVRTPSLFPAHVYQSNKSDNVSSEEVASLHLCVPKVSYYVKC